MDVFLKYKVRQQNDRRLVEFHFWQVVV